ncbi:MAG: Alpha/Beta hydrolase protein [Monoraphidium minutum]|nr:MAG: Alpha/Beta hydrolase protein [Monoraphidium minutum]
MRWRKTSPAEAVAAEQGMLGLLESKVVARNVPVGPGSEDFVRTLEVAPGGGSASSGGAQPPVVYLPGYGAGSLFLWRNIDALAPHMRLFACDWLGTGRSGRPPFTARGQDEAEGFFIDSLDAWRRAEGLEGRKMVLVGHSLGGYLAAAYALRHPDHVQHLVLVCPAGIPEKPDGWESRFTSGTAFRRLLFRAAAGAWEAGVTPGAVIRGLGPWGPGLVGKYVGGRFSHHGKPLTDAEIPVFSSYFYHIAAAPGSGEYALRHLLAPGAWAHSPLHRRLLELQGVPVTFIYGEHDWMNPANAVALSAELDRVRPRAVESDHAVEIIPDAGHYVFIEQPEAFNQTLLRVLRPWLGGGAKGAPAGGGA